MEAEQTVAVDAVEALVHASHDKSHNFEGWWGFSVGDEDLLLRVVRISDHDFSVEENLFEDQDGLVGAGRFYTRTDAFNRAKELIQGYLSEKDGRFVSVKMDWSYVDHQIKVHSYLGGVQAYVDFWDETVRSKLNPTTQKDFTLDCIKFAKECYDLLEAIQDSPWNSWEDETFVKQQEARDSDIRIFESNLSKIGYIPVVRHSVYNSFAGGRASNTSYEPKPSDDEEGKGGGHLKLLLGIGVGSWLLIAGLFALAGLAA